MYLLHHCTFIIRKSCNLVSAINWTLSKVINLLVLLAIKLQRIVVEHWNMSLVNKKKNDDDTQRLILDLIDLMYTKIIFHTSIFYTLNLLIFLNFKYKILYWNNFLFTISSQFCVNFATYSRILSWR